MKQFRLRPKQEPPVIFQASIHNLSKQCLKRCLRPNDPAFDGNESRIGELGACINNCAFNYVKYRIEVREIFKATMDEVQANNDHIWNSFLQEDGKPLTATKF